MKADMGCTSVKEQTIRELLAHCHKAQEEIRALLEINFDRNPKECIKGEGRPSRPNVLDEIMDSLEDLNDAQRRAVEFISGNINSKL